MKPFKTILPEELPFNVFEAVGKGWMLVTAGREGRLNTMTASWGGMGVLWGKPVAFIFIRPQRYTREFVDAEPAFSLSFYDESFRSRLSLCGSRSGRDIDKAEACGFETVFEEGVPYFTQAHTVLICKKLYRRPLDPACFLDGSIGGHYPGRDYHIAYVAEITKVLRAE